MQHHTFLSRVSQKEAGLKRLHRMWFSERCWDKAAAGSAGRERQDRWPKTSGQSCTPGDAVSSVGSGKQIDGRQEYNNSWNTKSCSCWSKTREYEAE